MAHEILTLARYADICSNCRGEIEKGAIVMFNTFHKTVRHKKCPVDAKLNDALALLKMYHDELQQVLERDATHELFIGPDRLNELNEKYEKVMKEGENG